MFLCLFSFFIFFFFFNDTATTEIYTLSLHDALPNPRSGARIRTVPRNTIGTPTPRCAAWDRRRRGPPIRTACSGVRIAKAPTWARCRGTVLHVSGLAREYTPYPAARSGDERWHDVPCGRLILGSAERTLTMSPD